MKLLISVTKKDVEILRKSLKEYNKATSSDLDLQSYANLIFKNGLSGIDNMIQSDIIRKFDKRDHIEYR